MTREGQQLACLFLGTSIYSLLGSPRRSVWLRRQSQSSVVRLQAVWVVLSERKMAVDRPGRQAGMECGRGMWVIEDGVESGDNEVEVDRTPEDRRFFVSHLVNLKGQNVLLRASGDKERNVWKEWKGKGEKIVAAIQNKPIFPK
ncbi:hypothetical protein N7523_007896 [Penicillium sp. IBT 18751x]|nr:hypothetical protein N7523_007896 [Penicillium sp. IBT 18751x]